MKFTKTDPVYFAEPIRAFKIWKAKVIARRAYQPINVTWTISTNTTIPESIEVIPFTVMDVELGSLYHIGGGFTMTPFPTAKDGGAVAVCKCRDSKCDVSPCPPKNAKDAVVVGNGCGIYASKTTYEAMSEFTQFNLVTGNQEVFYTAVIGSVLLGGIIYEHEYGYRAQYAVVESLVLTDPEYTKILESLSAKYQVPIITPETFQYMERHTYGPDRHRMGRWY